MATETRRIFFWLSKTFLEIFFALATPHGFSSNSKENKKKTVFITFFGLKDCDSFKGRREMSRYQVVIFPRKSMQVKIHSKMAIFLVGF